VPLTRQHYSINRENPARCVLTEIPDAPDNSDTESVVAWGDNVAAFGLRPTDADSIHPQYDRVIDTRDSKL